MEYTLNPCKACWEKYRDGKCNINTVNSCVTETAAAFSGMPSANFLAGTDADTNWNSCMEKMMSAEDRSKCDLHLTMSPVFNIAPHYFPPLLAETQDPEAAKLQCIQKCDELRFNKKVCIENCITDCNAVDVVEPPRPSSSTKTTSTHSSGVYVAALIVVLVSVLAVYLYLTRK